jgi:hypothetical protein
MGAVVPTLGSFNELKRQRVQALVVHSDSLYVSNRTRIRVRRLPFRP